MRKRVKWSRPKKTLRNWLIVLMLGLMLYGSANFPPVTKGALVREILRENLMGDGEIVWEEINRQGYHTMYILCENAVLRASYFWNPLLWANNYWGADLLKARDGIVCIAGQETPGEILVIGTLPEAASAVLELRARNGLQQEKSREYTAEGVFESDKVISFTLSETYGDDAKFFADTLRRTVYPEGYYDYTLQLYDAAGQEIGVWTDIPEQEAQ